MHLVLHTLHRPLLVQALKTQHYPQSQVAAYLKFILGLLKAIFILLEKTYKEIKKTADINAKSNLLLLLTRILVEVSLLSSERSHKYDRNLWTARGIPAAPAGVHLSEGLRFVSQSLIYSATVRGCM